MKKLIPLHIQKIMMFIPFINCFIWFVWLLNYHNSKKEPKVFGKSLLIILCVPIPFFVLDVLFSEIFAEFNIIQTIIDYLYIYLTPLAMGYALIKYQKKVLIFEKTQESKEQQIGK